MFRSFLENLDFPVGGEKFWPAVDIVDRDDAIVVKAELPGCRAEDIDVSIHGNMLTISGEKKAEREKKEKGYYRVESSYGSFQRCIQLPAEVRQDKIEAVCKDGILTMTMPKSQPSRSIKVKVKENKE
jgi:HSP20 family protein